MPAPHEEYESQRIALIQELEDLAPRPLRSPLSRLIRPAIALSSLPTDEEPALSATKLGGLPDAPPGFVWPHFEEQPLVFLAQINLAEVAPLDVEERLPPAGLLSFWADFGEGISGEFGVWRVFHFEGERWQRVELPQRKRRVWGGLRTVSESAFHFSATQLEPGVWASLPDNRICLEFSLVQFEEELDQIFYDLSDSGHQMFGFPTSVQFDVREDASAQWNAFLEQPAARRLGLSVQDDQTEWDAWELLLQLRDDENAGLRWGDGGAVYFLIRSDDLAARRFDRVWFVTQNY